MTLVVPAAPGWSRWGGTMASQGPRRGRQRLTQTSEELKNAWRPARGHQGPPPRPHVQWCPGAERTTPSKTASALERSPKRRRRWEWGPVAAAPPPPDPRPRRYSKADRTQGQRSSGMATASTSGQSAFGLGRKKKNPGLMDQISILFGGDKKKRSKVGWDLPAYSKEQLKEFSSLEAILHFDSVPQPSNLQ